MTTLENLYYGNIRPYERTTVKGSETERMIHSLAEIGDELISELSPKQIRLFEKFKEAQMKLALKTEAESYIDGFCLGVKMMKDIDKK